MSFPSDAQGWNCRGLGMGRGWTLSSCLQMIIFEWKSVLNCNTVQNFKDFNIWFWSPSSFRSIPTLPLLLPVRNLVCTVQRRRDLLAIHSNFLYLGRRLCIVGDYSAFLSTSTHSLTSAARCRAVIMQPRIRWITAAVTRLFTATDTKATCAPFASGPQSDVVNNAFYRRRWRTTRCVGSTGLGSPRWPPGHHLESFDTPAP